MTLQEKYTAMVESGGFRTAMLNDTREETKELKEAILRASERPEQLAAVLTVAALLIAVDRKVLGMLLERATVLTPLVQLALAMEKKKEGVA